MTRKVIKADYVPVEQAEGVLWADVGVPVAHRMAPQVEQERNRERLARYQERRRAHELEVELLDCLRGYGL